MCRQTITGSQAKDDLSHLGRIAILLAPERLQHLDYRAYGWFIIREQFRHVPMSTSTPVCPHPARFKRTHLDAKRGHFLSQGFGESPDSPLGSMVGRAPGEGQATAD